MVFSWWIVFFVRCVSLSGNARVLLMLLSTKMSTGVG